MTPFTYKIIYQYGCMLPFNTQTLPTILSRDHDLTVSMLATGSRFLDPNNQENLARYAMFLL